MYGVFQNNNALILKSTKTEQIVNKQKHNEIVSIKHTTYLYSSG